MMLAGACIPSLAEQGESAEARATADGLNPILGSPASFYGEYSEIVTFPAP